jgi:Uma2 family endonuclease
MVLPSAQLHDETAALAPLVVVEILSPSTRRVDLELKRACYAAARCPSYWVVDPQVPSLTAWVLREGEYVGTVQVRGDDQFTTQQPYRVGLRPSQLVD